MSGTGVETPYGFWKSPITSDLIVAKSIGLSEVWIDGADIYWLELRPEEAGRGVVVRYGSGDVNAAPGSSPMECFSFPTIRTAVCIVWAREMQRPSL